MFQRATSVLGMFVLAGTVVLATAETSEAQRGGGRGGRSVGRSNSGGYNRGNSNYGLSYYGRPYYGRSYGFGYYPFGYSPFFYGSYFYPDSVFSDGVRRSYYPPSDAITDEGNGATARVNVSLPANAELWFNGTKMRSTGPNRAFDTPSLTGGQRYTYEARARWMENGRAVTQTQRISVVPGQRTQVSFPNPSGTE